MNTQPDLQRGKRQQQPQRRDNSEVTKLPPHSDEAEQGLLSCIFQDPLHCLPECIENLKRGAEEFYDLRHQTVFNTMLELYDDQIGIDPITIQQRMKDWGTLDQIGGMQYLMTLPDFAPSAANVEYYLDIVHEKFMLRNIVRTCTETANRVYEFEGDVEEIIERVEHDLLLLSQDRKAGTAMPTAVELVRQVLEDIDASLHRNGAISGLSTGFPDFDAMTDGLHPGETIIIAGRPSLGKTALAMNIVDHVAVTLGLPVGVFSMEMTSRSLMHRMVCSRARVNLRTIRQGFLAARDFPKIQAAAGTLSHAKLHIDDTGGLSVLQLRAKARRMKQQHDVKLIVADYVQLLSASGSKQKFNSRQEEVAFISTALKSLAKELGIPIIVISQLNRESEQKNYGKPKLSNLRDSGALEQDGDIIGLLYKPMHPDEDAPGDEDYEAIPTNLNIAKQRNGPTGDVELTFLRGYTRFESAAHVSPASEPNQSGLPYADH